MARMARLRFMKLPELLNVANQGYPDGYLAEYYDTKTGARKSGRGDARLGRRVRRITQCMSAFRYPNKNSNIITIKITPTSPTIRRPSRSENCSTAFLLPLDGQWLCMTMVGQRFANPTPRAVVPFRRLTAPGYSVEDLSI